MWVRLLYEESGFVVLTLFVREVGVTIRDAHWLEPMLMNVASLLATWLEGDTDRGKNPLFPLDKYLPSP